MYQKILERGAQRIAALLVPIMLCACLDHKEDSPRRRDAVAPDMLDKDRAFKEVQLLLEIPNRDSGTAGAEKAAHHIQGRLEKIEVTAEIDSFKDPTPEGIKTFHNVVATIPGNGDSLIVLGSHFDTKSGMEAGFEGANDSGSSTGLLIELARVLNNAPTLKSDLQLVFFDGEECLHNYSNRDGLHGSRHHAKKLLETGRADDVKAVIIMDMIGDKDLNIAFPRNTSPPLLDLAFQSARHVGLRSYYSLNESAILDDHVPFLKAGMPAIDFIDFHYGSQPDSNDYWHTPADTIDKISAESLEIVGRTVLQMITLLELSRK